MGRIWAAAALGMLRPWEAIVGKSPGGAGEGA